MRPPSQTSTLDSDPFRYSQFLLRSPVLSPSVSIPSFGTSHSSVSGPPPSEPPPPVPSFPTSLIEKKKPRNKDRSKQSSPEAQRLADKIQAILNVTASIVPRSSITPDLDKPIDKRKKKRIAGIWTSPTTSPIEVTGDAERWPTTEDSYFALQTPEGRLAMQSSALPESPPPESGGHSLSPAPSPGVALITRALQLGLRGGYGTPPITNSMNSRSSNTAPYVSRQHSYAESGVSSIDTLYSSDDFESYEPSAMTEEDRHENSKRPPLPPKSPLRAPSVGSASTVRHGRSDGGKSSPTTYWEPSSHFSHDPSSDANQNSSSGNGYDDYHNALRGTSDIKVSIHSLSEDDRRRLKAITEDYLSPQPLVRSSRANAVASVRRDLEANAASREKPRRRGNKDTSGPNYGHSRVENPTRRDYGEGFDRDDAVVYQPPNRSYPRSPPALFAGHSLRQPPQRPRPAHLQPPAPPRTPVGLGKPSTTDLIGPNKALRDQDPRPYEELEDYGRELQFRSQERAAEYIDARAGRRSQWKDPENATTIYPPSLNFRSSVDTDDLGLTQIMQREQRTHRPNALNDAGESGAAGGLSSANETEEMRLGIKARFDKTMVDYIEQDRPRRREIVEHWHMKGMEKQMRLRELDDKLKKKVMLAREATGYDFVDNETAIREAIRLHRSIPDPIHSSTQIRSAFGRPSSDHSKHLQKATLALRFLGRLGKFALRVPTDPALKSYSRSHPDEDEELEQLYPTILVVAPSSVPATSGPSNPKSRSSSKIAINRKSSKKVPLPWTRFAYQSPERVAASDDWICRGLEDSKSPPQPQPTPRFPPLQGSGSGSGAGTGTGKGKGKGKEAIRGELFPPLRLKTPVYASSGAPTVWPDIDLSDFNLGDLGQDQAGASKSPAQLPSKQAGKTQIMPQSPVKEKVRAEEKDKMKVKRKEVPVLSPHVFAHAKNEKAAKMSPTGPGDGKGGSGRERQQDSGTGSSPRTVFTAWPDG